MGKHMMKEDLLLDIVTSYSKVDTFQYDVTKDSILFTTKYFPVSNTITTISMKDYSEYVDQDDRQNFLNEIDELKNGEKKSIDLKFRLRPMCENKRCRIIRVLGKACDFNENGKTIKVVGIYQEISNMVQHEDTVVKIQERLITSQKMAHIGDWEYNVINEKFIFSEEALNVFGLDYYLEGNNELYLLEIDSLINTLETDILKDLYDIALNYHRESFDKELPVQINGALKKIHIIANSKKDQFDKVTSIIGTVQDITERNQLEEALRQAEKMTAVGQLAGGIAHDFNNILMAASGYAELISMKVDDPAIKKYCDKILKSVKRSSDLTSKLLAFSRKDSMFKKKLNIHDHVKNVLELVARTISRNIIIEGRFCSEDDEIFGDSTEIQNVFMNLCLNARDALTEGGVISVTSETVTLNPNEEVMNEFNITPGEYICFTVRDNGCGIEEENIKKIFDPFFTTKEVGKGTGLGLAAIYGTMVTHNGAITVESEVGVGTIFNLYFPII